MVLPSIADPARAATAAEVDLTVPWLRDIFDEVERSLTICKGAGSQRRARTLDACISTFAQLRPFVTDMQRAYLELLREREMRAP